MGIESKHHPGKSLTSLLGAHFSIAKGLHHALLSGKKYDCSAVQLFTKNAGTWRERTLSPNEVKQFLQTKKETGIDIAASHASYLINLGSGDPDKRKKFTVSPS